MRGYYLVPEWHTALCAWRRLRQPRLLPFRRPVAL